MSGRTDPFGDPLPDGAVARLGTMRLRQPGVRSLAFSKDGGTLASGGDRPVQLWEVATGKLLRTLDPSVGTGWSVAFDEGGTLGGAAAGVPMALWSGDTRALQWRPQMSAGGTIGWEGKWVAVESGRLLVNKRGVAWFATPLDGVEDADAAVGFGGRRVAVALENGDVRIFEIPGAGLVERIPCGGIATAVAVSASGGTLAAGFADGRIGMWDIATRRQIAEWPAHPAAVDALAFSRDAQTLASGAGTRIRLWNPASGGERLTLPTFEEAPARVSFHPDAPRIVTRTGLLLQEWDPETGAELSAIAARGPWDDGNRLPESRFALVESGPEWAVWDTALGRETLRVPREGAAAISPDGALFATGGWAHGLLRRAAGEVIVKLMELPSGNVRWTYPVAAKAGPPTFLRFLPGGDHLLAGETFDRVSLLDAKNGKQRRVLQGPVAFSRDGELIASTAASEDQDPARRVEILLRAPKPKHGWTPHLSLSPRLAMGPIRAMAFAPFRRLVAVANEAGTIDVWDLEKPKPTFVRFPSGPAHELVFSADARRLASVSWSSAEVLVWDVPA